MLRWGFYLRIIAWKEPEDVRIQLYMGREFRPDSSLRSPIMCIETMYLSIFLVPQI